MSTSRRDRALRSGANSETVTTYVSPFPRDASDYVCNYRFAASIYNVTPDTHTITC